MRVQSDNIERFLVSAPDAMMFPILSVVSCPRQGAMKYREDTRVAGEIISGIADVLRQMGELRF